ncbi:polyamine aminopropyltransferase [Marinicrinis sediminis]|uniref:Polyamine aminopropyltransferase n=1 Tax=Marinicrinis sediminis TaxID=1652465 RepID=A0ABW5REQ6_9BACL
MKPINRIYTASAIVSICGITFQVLLGALGSYTFGDGVRQYAFTIGFFLSGMGIGSALSERVIKHLIERFIVVELIIGTVGGFSSFVLFWVLAYSDYEAGQVMLFAMTILIGMLTGLELPILIRRASEIGEQLNRSTARVLFSDYAGSLIGAVGFALLLRPWLGMIKTAFLIGLINLAVAMWMVFSFRGELRRPRWLQSAALSLMALMMLGFLFGEQYAFGFEQKLYRDPIVRSFDTPYQRVVLTKEQDTVRLYLNGNIQFSSSDEYRYHESLVHPAMSATSHHDQILVLGGGDGMAVRELLKYEDVERITVVDLDEQFVSFAMEEPLMQSLHEQSLQSPKVRLKHMDAFEFLKEDNHLYDVVIVDLPDPNNESLNKLYTVHFYQLLRNHLHPDGFAAIQATSPLFAVKAYWTIDATLQEAGLKTMNYHADIPSFGDWGFILASRKQLSPEELTVQVPTRYLTNEVIPALFRFGKDQDNVTDSGEQLPVEPNTLNHPTLLHVYQEAWQNY